MDDIGLVDNGASEVPAQLFGGPEVYLPPSEQGGKLAFKSGKPEKANRGSWMEFDKHVHIAIGSEILT